MIGKGPFDHEVDTEGLSGELSPAQQATEPLNGAGNEGEIGTVAYKPPFCRLRAIMSDTGWIGTEGRDHRRSLLKDVPCAYVCLYKPEGATDSFITTVGTTKYKTKLRRYREGGCILGRKSLSLHLLS